MHMAIRLGAFTRHGKLCRDDYIIANLKQDPGRLMKVAGLPAGRCLGISSKVLFLAEAPMSQGFGPAQSGHASGALHNTCTVAGRDDVACLAIERTAKPTQLLHASCMRLVDRNTHMVSRTRFTAEPKTLRGSPLAARRFILDSLA